jgi:GNAT superfamily N-acetyltransferase
MMTTPVPLRIRNARPEDAAVVAEFNARLAAETEGRTLEPAVLAEGVRQAIADPAKALYWLAEVDGRVVGQLMLTLEWSDWRNGWFWWIQSVYVHPDWRGRGVFTQLYRWVETEARRRADVCGLRLYMENDNARARRTYERLGLRGTHYQVFETEFGAR